MVYSDKWYASKLKMEIFSRMRSFHFHDFFAEDRIKGDPSKKAQN